MILHSINNKHTHAHPHAVATLLVCVIFACINAQELDYGIMIDAGSSGSRIFLYDWPHRDNNSLPLVEPVINQTVISMKNNVPISSFVNDPENAGASLAPLVQYILNHLESSKWNVTPIYLKATAGMRALNITSQDEIIASVQKYLASTPFEFQPDYAQVIPGTYEGIFGWITMNYAMNILQQMDPTTTYGALDMGGASTQITFVPQSPPQANGFSLDLGGVEYSLYTYSYPLGQDASLDLLLTSLMEYNDTNSQGFVLNPCYLDGYNETFNSYLVIGTANFSACIEAVGSYIVVKSPGCDDCGVGKVYQPPVYGNYLAFSGFAYTFGFLGLSNTSTIADLLNATEAFCNTPWEEVLANNKNTPAAYLKFYCFTGSYFSTLLTSGYGFAANSTNLIVQSSIGSIELTWALGGMIYEASLLPFGPSKSEWLYEI